MCDLEKAVQVSFIFLQKKKKKGVWFLLLCQGRSFLFWNLMKRKAEGSIIGRHQVCLRSMMKGTKTHFSLGGRLPGVCPSAPQSWWQGQATREVPVMADQGERGYSLRIYFLSWFRIVP